MLYPDRFARNFFIFLLLLLLWPTAVFAQGTETTGTIKGRVYGSDTGTQGLPGATVTLKNEETGLMRTVKTSGDGSYSFALLSPGSYMISASHPDYEEELPNSTINRFTVFIARDNVVKGPPPITLRRKGSGPPPTPTTPVNRPQPSSPPPRQEEQSEAEQLVNLSSAARTGNFDQRQLTSLPLPGIRTFDTLALLLPGVALPPQPIGNIVGPGLGAGIGSAGQFSVNGQRARSNNFTVDGSDNNDEDVGVRRQGFVSLVPQSIESVQDFQVSTQVWDAGMGRNLGSQVNAVSRSGANQIHGAFYDFFNHNALNARNFFDYTSDKAQSYPLMARARFSDGTTRDFPVTIDGVPVVQPNPSEGRDPYRRNQGGIALGVPISKKYFGPLGSDNPTKTFFFGSLERQDIKARQETHFAVPTVAQRGLLNFGATGFIARRDQASFKPTFFAGDYLFSLFPFPNNPIGPYGENTFTEVLPADAEGTIFSLKLDHNFKLFGPNRTHSLAGRYNFTNDRRQVSAVGGAIFSGIEPRVRTQNLSLLLNSQLSASLANQLRGSYGRTRLRFNALRDPLRDETGKPFLRPSKFLPNDPLNSPFLLNARALFNESFPNNTNSSIRSCFGCYVTFSNVANFVAEDGLGPVGQVIVTPFSPVGLDVSLFPQARTNNTYQIADNLTILHGHHTLKLGADLRRTQLNSFLNRNFRPQVTFGGTLDVTSSQFFPVQIPIRDFTRNSPTPGFFSGTDLASLGLPTNIFQSLSIGTPDSTIGLRFWQYNFFFNGNWRVRPGLTLDYGLRYEYNTVPQEVNRRIENTFSLAGLPAANQALSQFFIFDAVPLSANVNPLRVFINTPPLVAALNAPNGPLAALRGFLGGRQEIYEPDRNNFGPHLSFAWDPFASSATQAGKTAVRGGVGVYYDVTLGSVVSQSRNVFPTFVPVNLDANTFYFARDAFFQPAEQGGIFRIPNQFFIGATSINNNDLNQFTRGFLTQVNTLNVIGVPPGSLQALLGLLFTASANLAGVNIPSGGGLAFTLPDRHLRSPYALHFNLQVERELFKDYLVNLAYVGSRGLKLTRFRTPNGGPNSLTFPVDPLGVTLGTANALPAALALPPLALSNLTTLTRPNPALGAYTIFDSSANSTYHAFQASVTKRFSGGRQITAAYTWSHAIDDVSDVFDLAGAFALPQDDRNLRAERGNANFDIRHRFVWSSISNVPFISRFNDAHGAKRVLLGGWQFASISTYQTGQPFTVNTSFDANGDGNLTDRLDSLSGISLIDSRQEKLRLTASLGDLLRQGVLAPPGQNGRVGRNTFRATGIVNTDFTLIKNFRVKEGQDLVLRVEAFNLMNRTHFGVPVRILEAPSFGRSVNTSLNSRQVQFALKYVF